jgi:hypothetical protein
MAAAAARGSHVTARGIPQGTADQNGAIVEQRRAIAMPSRFGVALMRLIAVVEAIPGGVFVVHKHRKP